ncbi:MAG: hypothetical protein ACOYN3_10010, partial [Acidimicrobiia bacterium]
SAKLLSAPLTGDTSQQQRKGITIYLPPGLNADALRQLVVSLSAARTTDPIADEHELVPGVYLRAEHHIRFPHGVDDEQYSGLYRSARRSISDADKQARAILALHPGLITEFAEDVLLANPEIQLDPRVGLMRTALQEYLSYELVEAAAMNFDATAPRGEPTAATPEQLRECFDHLCAMRALLDDGKVSLNRVNLLDETEQAIQSGMHIPIREIALGRIPELGPVLGHMPVAASPRASDSKRVNETLRAGTPMFFATESGTQYHLIREGNHLHVTIAIPGVPPTTFDPIDDVVKYVRINDTGALEVVGQSRPDAWTSLPLTYIGAVPQNERAFRPAPTLPTQTTNNFAR